MKDEDGFRLRENEGLRQQLIHHVKDIVLKDTDGVEPKTLNALSKLIADSDKSILEQNKVMIEENKERGLNDIKDLALALISLRAAEAGEKKITPISTREAPSLPPEISFDHPEGEKSLKNETMNSETFIAKMNGQTP